MAEGWKLAGVEYASQRAYEEALREKSRRDYERREEEHYRKYCEAVERYRNSGASYEYTADGERIVHN